MSASPSPSPSDARIRVLILGGWSPGPLDTIRWVTRGDAIDFFEPPLHMPPAGCRWCCTWECLLICVCIYLTAGFSSGHMSASDWPAPLRILAVLGCILSIFLAVVLLVRGSIRRCVWTATRMIANQHIDVVVGFSWGGGVACWLLAEHRWHGPTLLLAPTLAAMTACARLPTPTFRARGADNERDANADDASAPPFVSIFHATDDGFCPDSQHAPLAASGAAMHTCDDVHVFCMPQSEQEIVAAFGACVDMARRSRWRGR